MTPLHWSTGRIFIVVGVLVTVISALLNHYLAYRGTEEIDVLRQRIQTLDERIRQRWEQVQQLERQEDMATLLALLERPGETGDRPAIAQAYLDKLAQRTGLGLSHPTLATLADAAQRFRMRTVDEINEYYGERLRLIEQMQDIGNRNQHIASFALFLQLMGMILVLSFHTP